MLLHIDESDDFGILLATAQEDTIGAVTVKPIWRWKCWKFVRVRWLQVLIPIRLLRKEYDLVNTSLHLYEPRIFALDKGLFKEGMQFSDIKSVERNDFEEFGRRIGMGGRLVKRELDFFATPHPLAKELVDRSFLSEALKRDYWLSYDYRRVTLTFGKWLQDSFFARFL